MLSRRLKEKIHRELLICRQVCPMNRGGRCICYPCIEKVGYRSPWRDY